MAETPATRHTADNILAVLAFKQKGQAVVQSGTLDSRAVQLNIETPKTLKNMDIKLFPSPAD